MKTLRHTLIILITVFSIQQVSAQFGKSKKVDLPATYDFEWTIKMEMKAKQGSFNTEYFLKKDAKYFGFKNDQLTKANKNAGMFMVIDKELNVNAIFMSMMGQNIKQTTKISDFDDEEDDNSKYEITEIGSKTILGYTCQGFKTENAEHEVTFYVTNDVPVSFTQIWEFDKKSKPKGFKSGWMKYAKNGLVMEMNFVDKKKAKYNTTMTCVAIEKTDLSIDTTLYKYMF